MTHSKKNQLIEESKKVEIRSPAEIEELKKEAREIFKELGKKYHKNLKVI